MNGETYLVDITGLDFESMPPDSRGFSTTLKRIYKEAISIYSNPLHHDENNAQGAKVFAIKHKLRNKSTHSKAPQNDKQLNYWEICENKEKLFIEHIPKEEKINQPKEGGFGRLKHLYEANSNRNLTTDDVKNATSNYVIKRLLDKRNKLIDQPKRIISLQEEVKTHRIFERNNVRLLMKINKNKRVRFFIYMPNLGENLKAISQKTKLIHPDQAQKPIPFFQSNETISQRISWAEKILKDLQTLLNNEKLFFDLKPDNIVFEETQKSTENSYPEYIPHLIDLDLIDESKQTGHIHVTHTYKPASCGTVDRIKLSYKKRNNLLFFSKPYIAYMAALTIASFFPNRFIVHKKTNSYHRSFKWIQIKVQDDPLSQELLKIFDELCNPFNNLKETGINLKKTINDLENLKSKIDDNFDHTIRQGPAAYAPCPIDNTILESASIYLARTDSRNYNMIHMPAALLLCFTGRLLMTFAVITAVITAFKIEQPGVQQINFWLIITIIFFILGYYLINKSAQNTKKINSSTLSPIDQEEFITAQELLEDWTKSLSFILLGIGFVTTGYQFGMDNGFLASLSILAGYSFLISGMFSLFEHTQTNHVLNHGIHIQPSDSWKIRVWSISISLFALGTMFVTFNTDGFFKTHSLNVSIILFSTGSALICIGIGTIIADTILNKPPANTMCYKVMHSFC